LGNSHKPKNPSNGKIGAVCENLNGLNGQTLPGQLDEIHLAIPNNFMICYLQHTSLSTLPVGLSALDTLLGVKLLNLT
jgi:hypothetical protein